MSTRQTRVNADIGDMISDILKVREDLTSATLLDPIVRASIVAMHKQYKPQIDRIRAAEEKFRLTVAQARVEAEEAPPEPPKRPPAKR